MVSKRGDMTIQVVVALIVILAAAIVLIVWNAKILFSSSSQIVAMGPSKCNKAMAIKDYYRDVVKYRGIGVEHINHVPGMFGYQENKYYYSAPPPRYDVTQAVQPYNMWRREQLRMGTINSSELKDFEKKHTYVQKAATF